MRVLAIQLNQPGDAVLTTPALRWLMNQGHEVHALLQPLGAQLLQTLPGLASVEALPRDSIQLVRDIRRTIHYRRLGFDQAIVFSKCSDRPALWALLSGAKKRSGRRRQTLNGLDNHWNDAWRKAPQAMRDRSVVIERTKISHHSALLCTPRRPFANRRSRCFSFAMAWDLCKQYFRIEGHKNRAEAPNQQDSQKRWPELAPISHKGHHDGYAIPLYIR